MIFTEPTTVDALHKFCHRSLHKTLLYYSGLSINFTIITQCIWK